VSFRTSVHATSNIDTAGGWCGVRSAGQHLGDGGDVPGEPASRLRSIAARLPAGIAVDSHGQITAVPAGTGTAAALTRILLIAAEAATLGTWTRLKACSADDCQWAFYDRSPARTGCWCSMQICGARSKSRAYRRRAAAQAKQ
jgi:predicted RNA-binding Zn ribbon-like protein